MELMYLEIPSLRRYLKYLRATPSSLISACEKLIVTICGLHMLV